MTELRVETCEMPAADLGPENPLPPLKPLYDVGRGVQADESVSEADREHLNYGTNAPLLPYHAQDGYNRAREPRRFPSVVLENDVLRATVLITLGGRLWALKHKPSGRDLLYCNPVFQPANLAIRNAWFCGGVEWNCSVRGHSVHTCSPMFAAVVRRDDGCPVLRLYEWERIRRVPYQIDICLPEGSPFLYVYVRIINPHDRTIPMYWWSNMGVTANPDTRVIVPAERALVTAYTRVLSCRPIPMLDGRDITYSTNHDRARDFFFRLPDEGRPWITALDGEGRGVIQTSTRRLKGRKLFVWGTLPGGQRWQEYLSGPDNPHMELQAGLCRTQSECVPMPGHATWSWLEAYGLMEADPAAVHGSDWGAARAAVSGRLDERLPESALHAEHERMDALADRPPERMIQQGSGWAALERKRLERAGERISWSPGIPFDDASLTDDQTPWVALLEEGGLPGRDPSEGAGMSLVQPEWRALLEAAVAQGRGDHWLSWLHLGVMRYAADEIDSARQAWERSVELAPSAWAYRNLAVLAGQAGEWRKAADLYGKALALAPDLRPLIIECCKALLQAERPAEVRQTIAGLGPPLRNDGRMLLLEAQAALAEDELDTVERILAGTMDILDVREGEVLTTDVWFALHERRIAQAENVPVDDALRERVRRECPPPARLDFRMVQ